MPWRALLRGDPIPWLLERSDPAVRANTLRSLLERGPRDPELREAQARAMSAPPISTIFKRQGTEDISAGLALIPLVVPCCACLICHYSTVLH